MDQSTSQPWAIGTVDFTSMSTSPIVANYIAAYGEMHPHLAIKAGLHAYDGRVADWENSSISCRCTALHNFCEQLEPIAATPITLHPTHEDTPSALARNDMASWDARLALWDAKAELFRWTVTRPHETNPLVYIPLLDLSPYMRRPGQLQTATMQALLAHIAEIPRVLTTARAQLGPMLPPQLATQAVETLDGLATFHTRDLPAIISHTADLRQQSTFHRINQTVVLALHDTVTFLRGKLMNSAPIKHITPDYLRQMLASTEMVDMPIERLLAIGEEDLAQNRERLQKLAVKLKKTPADAVREVGQQHPPVNRVLDYAREAMRELRRFVIDRSLVTVPAARECIIHESLPFMRNGSAFIDAPGPFEMAELPATYYLTLPDPSWSLDLQEAWMAKQGLPGLANTTAHEVWPGHYLHFLHLTHAPTVASKLFTCTSFTEGWAHYSEELIIEAGYHAHDPHYAIQQVCMALLRDCRYLIAIKLQLGMMTLDEACDLIEREAYFPPVRARQEALRGIRDPSYLNYTLGKLLFLRLRADLQAAHPEWSIRTLHDTLLGFGSPPLPLLRSVLIGSPWDDV
jgi:Bacterial protein of unknown function (DUF885)